MSLTDNRRKKRGQTASTITEAEHIIANQVTSNRQEEVLEYLKLFGYKPDRTILQVHIPGFFNKRQVNSRAIEQREAAVKRYGGTTFVIVGRTHDPAIMDLVIKPKKKGEATSPGYVGYLWKSKDPQKRAPHEVIPLDFTPLMSHIRQTGRVCSPLKDSWWHSMCQRLLQSKRTSYQGPYIGQARRQTLGSAGTLLKKLEVVAMDSKQPKIP